MPVRCPRCEGDFQVQGEDYIVESRITDTTLGVLLDTEPGYCRDCKLGMITQQQYLNGLKMSRPHKLYIKLWKVDWPEAGCFGCNHTAAQVPIFALKVMNHLCEEPPPSLNSCTICLGKVIEEYLPLFRAHEKAIDEHAQAVNRIILTTREKAEARERIPDV